MISQGHYVLSMLIKFRMTDCKSIATPLDRNVKLRPESGTSCDLKRFRQIVGSLIYLTITRPDPSYSVEMISQFMQRPALEHLHCVHRILRYVSDTKDRGLLYRHGITEQLAGYTDVDLARDATDRQSTSSFIFSLGSAAIAWSRKKQPKAAMSTTKGEYRGATIATCEAIWLKRLLQGLHFEVPNLILIYCNNSSSMELAKNPVFHARTKHIEVNCHFVRERVQSGEVELWYVHTNQLVVDIFTKVLGTDKLQHFFEMFGTQHLDVPHLRHGFAVWFSSNGTVADY